MDLLCLQKEDLKRILGPEKLRALRDEFRFMVSSSDDRNKVRSVDCEALRRSLVFDQILAAGSFWLHYDVQLS